MIPLKEGLSRSASISEGAINAIALQVTDDRDSQAFIKLNRCAFKPPASAVV